MRPILPLALALLAACSPAYQTTSGADYLAARDTPVADPAIRAAAAVEGELRFPARMGLVRLVDGRIADFPGREREVLEQLAANAAPLGTFQPISLILGSTLHTDYGTGPVDRARIVAARQHLDYLLVLAHNTGTSSVEAVFVDVRTGYPYATAQASVTARALGHWAGDAAVNGRTLALTEEILPQLAQMLTGLSAQAQQ